MRTTITCAALLLSYLAMTGRASVPMEGMEETSIAKKFNPPVEGRSGLYIYRPSSLGGALKKDIWVDGNVSAKVPRMFFSMKKLKVIKATKFLQNLSSPLMT